MNYREGEYVFWKVDFFNIVNGGKTGYKFEYTCITSKENVDEDTIQPSQLNSLARMADSPIFHEHLTVRHEIEYMVNNSKKIDFS